jgi:predicted enzyme related to lactoylglutathione lyase
MNQGIKVIIYPVKDLAQAKAQFTKLLGVEPYSDAPYYVGYKVGGQDIGLDPNGHKSGMTGPVAFYEVDDIKQCVQDIIDAGGQVQQALRDVGAGRQIASVKDAENNVIGLLQDPK